VVLVTQQPDEIRSAEGANDGARVLLISMPYGPLFRPSIGLSLLQAALKPLGVSAETLYLTFPFAELTGRQLYRLIANGYPEPAALLGEWIFAAALFGEDAQDAEDYLREVIQPRLDAHKRSPLTPPAFETHMDPDGFIKSVLEARAKAGEFLNDCAERVVGRAPSVVGFTSVFQQQVASLALARRIKDRRPETLIIFGGANCESVMGTEVINQFPFVDAVVSGEGDIVFPDIIQRVLNGKPLSGMQGVYVRGESASAGSHGKLPNAPMVQDMDALPYPNYEDFFQQLETSNPKGSSAACLLFETSRGCWWGAKSHCTFCGLNGLSMTYRSKSSKRALDELLYLIEKYPMMPVEAVDNILDMSYFKELIPEIAERGIKLDMFYEVKANLKKGQVRLLRDAGIRTIQPGVESLSSKVLALMRKGASRLQNVQLLKWCKEYGVRAQWNLIWGFPGESPEEYAAMAELLPLLSHLPPPETMGPLRLDRFSPYFNQPEQFGIANLEPCPAYRYVYPFAPAALSNLAYYFTFECRSGTNGESYVQPLVEQVSAWKEAHELSDLFFKHMDSYLIVFDLRPAAKERLSVLQGLQRILYVACDSIQSLSALRRRAQEDSGRQVCADEILEALAPLEALGLLLREGDSFLSLAIPQGEYVPRRAALERFFNVG
jgi:ribosomal peptide maturation radical SAM protein 1